MTTTATVSEADITSAYEWALNHAEQMANGRGARPGSELAEYLRDAATDGVMKALEKFTPGRRGCGLGFVTFSAAVVKKRVKRAFQRFQRNRDIRPVVRSIHSRSEDRGDHFQPVASSRPSAGEIPLSDEVKELPPDLRDAMRFYYVDGLTMQDIGYLMGTSKVTVRNRLREAAQVLAPEGVSRRLRPKREKRLCRG